MKVINLSQRSPEWLAWRELGVTASQAAAVLGRSPFETAWHLWAVRTGLLPPLDLSGNFFVQRGVQFEDQARQGYEERHDELALPACAEHDQHPALRASFDGINTAGEPVELKVPWKNVYQQVLAEREQSAAYRYYWVQVQFQIAVAGSARGWLVFDPCHPAASAGAVEFEIARDEAFITGELIPRCLAFWEAIFQKQEPSKDPARDFYTPEGEHAGAWDNLAKRYRHLDHQKARLDRLVKQLTGEMKTIQGALVEQMGEWVLADRSGIKVTRFQQSVVDTAGMLAELVPAVPEDVRAQHTKKDWRVKVTVAKAKAAGKPARQPKAAPTIPNAPAIKPVVPSQPQAVVPTGTPPIEAPLVTPISGGPAKGRPRLITAAQHKRLEGLIGASGISRDTVKERLARWQPAIYQNAGAVHLDKVWREHAAWIEEQLPLWANAQTEAHARAEAAAQARTKATEAALDFAVDRLGWTGSLEQLETIANAQLARGRAALVTAQMADGLIDPREVATAEAITTRAQLLLTFVEEQQTQARQAA